MNRIRLALLALAVVLWTSISNADPNVYYGGVQAMRVNVVAAFGVDNTGATDAWPKLLTALAATANSGQIAFMPDGTYKCATAPVNAQIPNGAYLEMAGPGVTINSVLPVVDGHTSTPFYRSGWQPSTLETTLASNVVQGASTFSVVSATGMAIGQDTILSSQDAAGEMQAGYTIVNVSGTTITVDRPILKPFTAGAYVQLAPTFGFPRNITIVGNGAKMTGTGDRWVQLVMCRDCRVSGLHLNNVTLNQIAVSYDYGSLRSTFDQIVIDGASSFTWGMALEDAEFGTIKNSYVTGTAGTGIGIVLNETEESSVFNSTAEALPGDGFLSTYEGTGARGTHGGGFFGCRSISNAQGFVLDYATDATIDDSATYYNVGYGFDAIDTSTGIHMHKVRAYGNGQIGVNLNSGAAYTAFLNDVVTSGNGAAAEGVHINMNTTIVGLTTSEPATAVLIDGNSVTANVYGWRHTEGPSSGFTSAFTVSGTGDWVTLDHSWFVAATGVGTNFGVYVTAASTINLSNYVHSPAGGSYGLIAQGGGYINIGPGVDVSGATTPLDNVSGGFTMAQEKGTYTSVATTGTDTMSQPAAQVSSIVTAASLGGDTTVNAPAGVPGLTYSACDNATLNGHVWKVGVTGGTAITIATGKCAIVKSDGTNMIRVSPDT